MVPRFATAIKTTARGAMASLALVADRLALLCQGVAPSSPRRPVRGRAVRCRAWNQLQLTPTTRQHMQASAVSEAAAGPARPMRALFSDCERNEARAAGTPHQQQQRLAASLGDGIQLCLEFRYRRNALLSRLGDHVTGP